MTKPFNIFKVAAAFMAACAFLIMSCEKTEEGPLTVSVKSQSVSSASGQQFVSVKADGSWTLSVLGTSGSMEWASLSVTSGSGSKNNIILTYQENQSTEARELILTLQSGSRQVSCNLIQEAAGSQEEHPEQDKDPETEENISSSVRWMELPAMDDPDLGYYSHSFEMNGKTYRNYSFGWSQEDFTAVWVAYPLCRMYTNKAVERTDEWDYDPLLGSEYSPAPFNGYGGSYARGHQVPSADRLCCYKANAQTFYGTNLTPQLNAHNEGIWQKLEDKVRTIANASDTMYVVTGVMIDNPKDYTTDSTRDKRGDLRPASELKTLPVPSHYFKALLRYSKSSTLGVWNAAAFYLEHRSYSESLGKAHSMSIDELEEITGLDFFVNLPAMVGEDQAAQIEAADPAESSVWW